MKNSIKFFCFSLLIIIISSCNVDQTIVNNQSNARTFKYLALGDSYTIGQNVCIDCRFPEQLKVGLENVFYNDKINLQIIAQTGWTTSNLTTSINSLSPKTDFDLVTLLIGVNNQYQGRPFSVFKQEFPQLVNRSILLAKGNKNNVIVVSIPDYAYTPFGRGSSSTSLALAQYNAFAEDYCNQNNIIFVNITDITQRGLIETNLVANDGLHPSQLAYAQFVERILPKAVTVLMD